MSPAMKSALKGRKTLVGGLTPAPKSAPGAKPEGRYRHVLPPQDDAYAVAKREAQQRQLASLRKLHLTNLMQALAMRDE